MSAAQVELVAKHDSLIESAECVVATLDGDTYGLTVADQLEALRMAARDLKESLTQWRDVTRGTN